MSTRLPCSGSTYFPQDIAFEVDGHRRVCGSRKLVCSWVGDYGNFGDAILPTSNGGLIPSMVMEPFRHDVAREIFGNFHAEPPVFAFGGEMRDLSSRVHMAENEVTAEFFPAVSGLLEI